MRSGHLEDAGAGRGKYISGSGYIRSGAILLQKSFLGDERNFLGPLVRLSCCEVRDHINCRKNDRWRSHRFYRARRIHQKPARQSTFQMRAAGQAPHASCGSGAVILLFVYSLRTLRSVITIGLDPIRTIGLRSGRLDTANIGSARTSLGQSALGQSDSEDPDRIRMGMGLG